MDGLLYWAWSLFDHWDTGPSLPMTVAEPMRLPPGTIIRLGQPGYEQRLSVSWREGSVLYVRRLR